MQIAQPAIGNLSMGYLPPLLINFFEKRVLPRVAKISVKALITVAALPAIVIYVAIGAVEYYIEDIV